VRSLPVHNRRGDKSSSAVRTFSIFLDWLKIRARWPSSGDANNRHETAARCEERGKTRTRASTVIIASHTFELLQQLQQELQFARARQDRRRVLRAWWSNAIGKNCSAPRAGHIQKLNGPCQRYRDSSTATQSHDIHVVVPRSMASAPVADRALSFSSAGCKQILRRTFSAASGPCVIMRTSRTADDCRNRVYSCS
jgi:hypothetical protein